MLSRDCICKITYILHIREFILNFVDGQKVIRIPLYIIKFSFIQQVAFCPSFVSKKTAIICQIKIYEVSGHCQLSNVL